MNKMTRPRGRPKRSDIEVLIVQGMNSESAIKCDICKRTFPRMKSLNMHAYTHSNVKKYVCDYPDCTKSFKQSSQLKNHLLLHSTEKPFICPAEGCMVRYAHSNRICSSHSNLKLVKQPQSVEEILRSFHMNAENLSDAQKNWLDEYLFKRERKLTYASVGKRKMDAIESLLKLQEGSFKKFCYGDEDSQEKRLKKLWESEDDSTKNSCDDSTKSSCDDSTTSCDSDADIIKKSINCSKKSASNFCSFLDDIRELKNDSHILFSECSRPYKRTQD